MSPYGDISGTWHGAAHNAASRSRALQKLSGPSGLHSGLAGDPPPHQQSQRNENARSMHRSGTEQSVPFRHAPRLVSPFVAQLLGQLLTDPERPGSGARTAYRIQGVCSSLLLDARL